MDMREFIEFAKATGNTVTGCSFMDESSGPVPSYMGDGNVLFPADWGHWRQATWRQNNNIPGCGWDREDGFKTCGVPTLGGIIAAAFLNFFRRTARSSSTEDRQRQV